MEYIRTATREFPLSGDVTLDYDGRSGNLLVEGADTDKVTVQIVAHVFEDTADAADAALRRIVEGVRQDERTVYIRPPESGTQTAWFFRFNRGMRVDYAVTVPRSTRCRLESRSGRVEVSRVNGPLVVNQRSGRTSVRAISADVQINSKSGSTDVDEVGGALTVNAASGRVSVRAVGNDARVHTASGSVQIERVGGSLELQSASGRLEANEVAGAARLHSSSGRITITSAGGAVRMQTVSGSVRFQGPVLGDLTVESVSGSVHLDVDPSKPFFIDAETHSGSLRSDLQPRPGEAGPEAGAPTARVRTTSGSIHIGRRDPVAFTFKFDRFGPDTGAWAESNAEAWANWASGDLSDLGDQIRERIEHAHRRAEEHAERARARAERHRMRAERFAHGHDDDEDDIEIEIDEQFI